MNDLTKLKLELRKALQPDGPFTNMRVSYDDALGALIEMAIEVAYDESPVFDDEDLVRLRDIFNGAIERYKEDGHLMFNDRSDE